MEYGIWTPGPGCWETMLHGSLVFRSVWWVTQQLPFFWAVFSRMFVEWTALEDTDTASLQSKGQVCLLSSITKIMSPFGGEPKTAFPFYQILIFPWYRVLLKNPLCVQVSPGPFHVAMWDWGWGAATNADTLVTEITESNWVLCYWPRSSSCSASIHETVSGELIRLQIE